MQLSIVIVCYKSLDLIEDCLNSIILYNDLNTNEIEIILIDNSPTDEKERLKSFLSNYIAPIDIRYIASDNVGYGSGNNIGINAAKGSIIAIMNPDVRLLEPLFKKTLQHFENESIGILGYRQILGQASCSFGQKPEFFIPIISPLQTLYFNKKLIFNEKKYYLSGAFILFRKTDFIKIGMFDNNFFMYFEESDIATRMNSAGKINYFDKTISYQHLLEHKNYANKTLATHWAKSYKNYLEKYNFNTLKIYKKRMFAINLSLLFYRLTNNKTEANRMKIYKESIKKEFEIW